MSNMTGETNSVAHIHSLVPRWFQKIKFPVLLELEVKLLKQSFV